MVNYDDVLNQIRGAGLLVDRSRPPFAVDGRHHRCPVEGMDRENRGWYILHEWRGNDGEIYIVGSYGAWQGKDNGASKVKLRGVQVSDTEKAAMRARMAEDRKRAIAARQREAEVAARRAVAVWRKLPTVPPAGATDYLARKGVQNHGGRYTPSGALVLPMCTARGDVRGLQFILPSKHPRRTRTGRDKEYWPAGLQKAGHWLQIGEVNQGGVCLVAEGYATAASLHEATGLPGAVAFDAGNLPAVAAAIKKKYSTDKILICADDDYLQRCRVCRQPTPVAEAACQHCGEPHGADNAGVRAASAAALQVGGAYLAPVFPADRAGAKLTDFNDLVHVADGGLHLVRQQIGDKLRDLGWRGPSPRPRAAAVAEDAAGMVSRLTVDEAADRFWLIYGLGGDVWFDEVDGDLRHRKDVCNLLPRRGHELLLEHPNLRIARGGEIGFDPTGCDTTIRCNLFTGWPMTPRPGKCATLLSLLEHLVSNEPNSREVYFWVLFWLAYPLQHPGAKMQTALVMHGPQGTGKSRFFEAIGRGIYGRYFTVLDQAAIEDKFNADWAQAKLFVIADEVLARAELYHLKNRAKGLVTSPTVRVNPKNVAAHKEKNHMNFVFLSNEHMPLALERDDRRHLVIWVPPKKDETFFQALTAEIDDGGVEALYHYLLHLDLGDFKPWTQPPMTRAKTDLIDAGLSSEERFVRAWMNLDVIDDDGIVLPFCPGLGSTLYRAYTAWCERHGERKRKAQDLIGFLSKQPGWRAGTALDTWDRLRLPKTEDEARAKPRRRVSRKMVVPPYKAIELARKQPPGNFGGSDVELDQLVGPKYDEAQGDNRADYLTACFFIFESPTVKTP